MQSSPTKPNHCLIVGGGLSGCEAAWQLAQRGCSVTLLEMRPHTSTKAHKTDGLAELVCSNSLRGAALSNAVGLLKFELIGLGSLIMDCALKSQLPAGGALAVDRDQFSALVTQAMHEHPLITIERTEAGTLPEATIGSPVIIATGPLTSPALARSIEAFAGQSSLAFYDAIAPILYADSLDTSILFRQSRYDKGGDDYLNCPLNKEEYYAFVEAVTAAEKYAGHSDVENENLENLRPFEGCMPLEDMIERGPETLRFGPFKPKGLLDPRTGSEPYAVMQLRQDNQEASLWSLVGMQTRMKRADQQRVFSMLPGLANAEFARFGSVHRNTFLNSPKCLNADLQTRSQSGLFFAGQITGVEGYVESTAAGFVAGVNAAQMLAGNSTLEFPTSTAIGGLLGYISDPARKDFQPMNINFGLMPSYAAFPHRDGKRRLGKEERRIAVAKLALSDLQNFCANNGLPFDFPTLPEPAPRTPRGRRRPVSDSPITIEEGVSINE
jgi:methylenetetrahydrofolate--tRNA-(uracil-5-)-methyltransferase